MTTDDIANELLVEAGHRRVRNWCAVLGAECDGDAFGMGFSHIKDQAEIATLPGQVFDQIMRITCDVFELWRTPVVTASRFYLLDVAGGVSPEVLGPHATAADRDDAAKLLAAATRDPDDALFWLDVDAEGVPTAGAFSTWFLEADAVALMGQLEKRGFSVSDTGGGCTAWTTAWTNAGGEPVAALWLTDDDGCAHSHPAADGFWLLAMHDTLGEEVGTTRPGCSPSWTRSAPPR